MADNSKAIKQLFLRTTRHPVYQGTEVAYRILLTMKGHCRRDLCFDGR